MIFITTPTRPIKPWLRSWSPTPVLKSCSGRVPRKRVLRNRSRREGCSESSQPQLPAVCSAGVGTVADHAPGERAPAFVAGRKLFLLRHLESEISLRSDRQFAGELCARNLFAAQPYGGPALGRNRFQRFPAGNFQVSAGMVGAPGARASALVPGKYNSSRRRLVLDLRGPQLSVRRLPGRRAGSFANGILSVPGVLANGALRPGLPLAGTAA